MKMNRFDDFTYIFLVNASQMAYLEDAHKTHDMLQRFNELYRYMIRNDRLTILGEELKALQNYIDLQISRYTNRFHITLVNPLKNTDIYIQHLCLLDFVDKVISNATAQYENYFNVRLELVMVPEIHITAVVEADNDNEVFRMTVTEEGK